MEDLHHTPPSATENDGSTTIAHEYLGTTKGRIVSSTKRTFSDREFSLPQSDISDHFQDAYPVSSSYLVDNDSPLGKRQRGVDWPLLSSAPVHDRMPLQRTSNISRSPSYREMPLKAHASRFIEGSMRDRRSVQPPSEYIEYGEYMESYDGTQRDMTKTITPPPRCSDHQRDNSVAPSNITNRSDTSKHSIIFKFGKSLAASFNPSNWKLRLKMSTVADNSAQKTALQKQKNEAEKVYQEFKNKGVFQTREIPPRSYLTSPEYKHSLQVTSGHQDVLEVHDETLQQDKRRGRIFSPLQYPNSLQDDGYVSEDAPSSIRSCLNPKKPTTPLLRKQSHPHSSSDQNLIGSNSLRQLPSRKGLQKQQKLVKKVSDLETKLELARRELRDVLGEPLPSQLPRAGRRPFIPGALSSLPSERLLSGCADVEVDFSNNIGQALSIGKNSNDYTHNQSRLWDKAFPVSPSCFENVEVIEYAGNSTGPEVKGSNRRKHDPIVIEPADCVINSVEYVEPEVEVKDAQAEGHEREKEVFSATIETEARSPSGQFSRQHTKKRKSSNDGRYRPSSESDDDAEWREPVKYGTPNKKNRRPSKIQKTNQGDTKAAGSERPQKSVIRTPRTPKKGAQARSLSMTPCNAQTTNNSIQTSPPPPSSDFVGVKVKGMDDLSNTKLIFPMPTTVTTKGSLHIYGNGFRAEPAAEDIPPVPKIPKELRTIHDTKFRAKDIPSSKQDIHNSLGNSGEVKRREQKRTSAVAETSIAMQAAKTDQEHFEWDADVF